MTQPEDCLIIRKEDFNYMLNRINDKHYTPFSIDLVPVLEEHGKSILNSGIEDYEQYSAHTRFLQKPLDL